MQIIKNKKSSLQSISQIMGDITKDIVNVIGYEKTMLLKNWKKAFPAEYRDMLSFDKLQSKKNGSLILYLNCNNSGIGMILHYEKINIIEKLASIVGSKMVADFKIIAK